MNISEFSVRNSVFGNMLTIAVFVGGLYASIVMRRELFPETDLDMVIIQTVYQNASPQEVENYITIPIEDEIRGIDGIDELISMSAENISTITVKLDPDVKNRDRVINDISRKADRVRDLPSGSERPEIEVITTRDDVIHVAVGGDVPETRLREYADNLKSRIESVQGVGSVYKVGWRDPEIWVETDPRTLIEQELSIAQVADSIKKQNVNMPGGKMLKDTTDVILRTIGEFTSLQDIEDVVVRSNTDGHHLTVRDVGSVTNTFAERSVIVRANGSRAVILDVVKKHSADTINVADEVKKLVAGEREKINDGIKLSILDFESFVIKRRLGVLLNNGFLGLALVMCLLPIFLNVRLAFLTALGIPFAFFVAIIIMSLVDVTINMITMFGIILVIGMLVDDAIIVTENVFRHMEMGKSRSQAAIDGTKEVIWPVTATVLTTIVAFVPLIFLPGIMGKVLKWVPIVVVITLSASLFEALVILPCHISEFGRFHVSKKRSRRENMWKKLHNVYSRLLKRVLNHRVAFLCIVVVTLVLSIAGEYWLMKDKVDLFPAELVEILTASVSAPEGTTMSVTEEKVSEVERKIDEHLADNELLNVITHVGQIVDMHGEGSKSGSRYATIFIYLTPEPSRDRTAMEIVAELRKECSSIDGLEKVYFEAIKPGPPVGKEVDIKIVGKDYVVLDRIADEMKAFLESYDYVTDVEDDHDEGKEELRVIVDRTEAARLGVNVETVAYTVYSAFEGVEATSIRNADEETKIRVRLVAPYHDKVEYLRNLRVRNNTGRLIELDKVIEIKTDRSVTGISHYNGERSVSVTAGMAGGSKNKGGMKKVNNEVWARFSNVSERYPGYRILRTGEWEESQKLQKAMIQAGLIALLLIYTILVIQFRSFVQPFAVLIAIPFGLIGVVLALLVHGKVISIMAMLGMVGMCGVVVNDAIVLVSFINDLRRSGVHIKKAIVEAAQTRLRPILLTSITTVAGMAPVIYGIGGYEPFIAPAAIVLAYGLLFATFLTLLVIPCLYSVGADMKERYWTKHQPDRDSNP